MKRNLIATAVAALFAAAALPALAEDKVEAPDSARTQDMPQQKKDMPQQKSKQQRDASAGASGKAQQAAGSKAQADKNAPLIVLVPVAVATTDTFGDGCWARLYDGTNFQGDRLALVGPVDMPNMRTAFGTDWGGEFDSIEVGPKATVTVYDNERYADKAVTFKPGERVQDMGGRMGMFQDVRSLKIACAGGAPTAKRDAGSSAGATKK